MNIIAVIPARAGSKRLPGKNMRLLGGKPLLAWSVETAIQCGAFSRVLVSTEDEDTARVARQLGAEVPWLRPIELASDDARSIDVVQDVIHRIQHAATGRPDAVMLLQPTSPFRTSATIRSAITLYGLGGGESVVSVSPVKSHPYWCMGIADGGVLRPFLEGAPANARSQDLPPVYVPNGSIYLASTETLLRGDFYSQSTRALVIHDPREALDIDEAGDWAIAEAMLSITAEGSDK